MKKVNTPLTDDDILGEVRYQSSQASGSEFASDELTASRKNALKYYLGRSRGDEIDGRSTVQSKDVSDMIDSMITQIMPTFTSPNIVQFTANSEQDEQQARIESNFCNHMVMAKNDGFVLLQTLIKDCLLSKNALAKVSVDINISTEKEQYKGLSKIEMFQVLQPNKPNQEVDVVKMDEATGDLTIKRITTKRRLDVDTVAPENFSITSEWKDQNLTDCTYCVERQWKTKSDLIEMGYDADIVMDLPTATSDTKVDSIERNQLDDEQNFFNTSPSMQICELEEHYIRIDQDGDGIAELHKVVTVENILLSNEEVDCIPYANGVAFLMGHRFYGLSVYDKIKDIQDIKTHFLRQWADNALINNHNKTDVIEDQVNMDDFLNGRPNAVRRVQSLDSCREVVSPDIGPSCQMALDYYDKVRTDRTGSSLDLQSNQMAMPSNVGDQGVNTLVANLEKVTALVTRNFTETLVKNLYLLVHKYLRLYFQEEMSTKMGSQWATTNPSQWLERDEITVTVPPTPTEKILQQVALEKAIMVAQQDMAAGKANITTSETQIYQMKLDYMRLSGIGKPEQYLTDPESPQAQQAIQMQQQKQQMEMQKQQQQAMEQQAIQNQFTQKQIENQALEITRNWESDLKDLEFKYTELQEKLGMDKYQTDVKAETDEAKIVGDATSKIQLESIKVEGMKDQKHNEMMKKMMEGGQMEMEDDTES